VRIEYEFRRDDTANQGVNILYIQATGDGQDGCAKDISLWPKKRELAAMSDYFNNMHTYHISYAAYPSDYVRGRRYMPLAGQGLKGTKLAGEYNKVQMFEDGNWLPVTVIKRAKEMWVEYTGVGKTLLCHFKNEDKPGIDEGRIGLRLMPGRLSSFRNFTVSLRPAGFLEPSTVPVTPVKSTPKRKSKKKAKQDTDTWKRFAGQAGKSG